LSFNFLDLYASQRKYGFGRKNPNDEAMNNFYVFQPVDFCNSSDFSQVSSVHFVLTILENSPADCVAPVVIECLGQTGVYVNCKKLTVGDKLILRHGYIISDLFLFKYETLQNAMPPITKGSDIFQKYFFAGSIGRGGFGVVHLCYNIEVEKQDENQEEEFKKYAVKFIKSFEKGPYQEIDMSMEKIMKEVRVMQNIKNNHVLELIAHYHVDKHLAIVFPYMKGGDLLHRINKKDNKRFCELESKFYFLQLMLGLEHMHKKGIAHRDIKLENILLNHDGDWPLLKLSDFGASKEITRGNNTFIGTLYYRAPEIVQYMHYTTKVDVWSSKFIIKIILYFISNLFFLLRWHVTISNAKWNLSFCRSRRCLLCKSAHN
jgi:tRNA A-37 threonylcarbamoyl transferase component Bud32